MKKIIITLSILSAMLIGCTDNFDPQIYGELSPSTFPSTALEYKYYTMEVYVPFQGKWGYESGNPDGWEYGWFSPELGHIEIFDQASDLMPIFSGWGGHFQTISSCNFAAMKNEGAMRHHFEKVRIVTRITKIIDDLENATVLTENDQKNLIAEAKMARAWNMYYMLHLYGPVPVILDPAKIGTDAEADVTRPTRSDYVSWVEEDLRYAADNLPLEAEDYGRFTKGTALTVLMRLYLNEKDFVNAEAIGREIMGLNMYSLVSEYANLFKVSTEVNDETIWAVSCLEGKDDGPNFNAYMYYCYPTDCDGISITGGGWGDAAGGAWSASWKFYNSFDTTDMRRDLFVTEYTSNASKQLKDSTSLRGAIFRKYPDEGAKNSYQGNDVIVCRYADILLMLAEAINENSGPVTEAVDLVNKIRTRAGLDDLSSSETASKEALREAIFIERGHEFYFEGLRKFDLVRMGKWNQSYLGQYGKITGPALWPLPDYAIINSEGKLEQNQGY